MTNHEQNKLEIPNLTLTVLEETFTIHKFVPSASIPEAVSDCNFYSVSRTLEELSLVCPEDLSVQSEKSSSNRTFKWNT